MKSKSVILPLLALIVFTQCSTFQYVTIDSHLKKNDIGEMIFENDTVMVKYKFTGENCPVTVQIYNKSNSPLYVDWKQSALIVDNKSVSHGG